MANQNLSAEQIIARAQLEGITVYQIAKLINFRLEANGFEPIRPQMMYNYNKNGLINGRKNDEVTLAEALAYVEKFATRRMAQDKYRKAQPVEVIETEVESTECEGQLSLI